LATAQDFTWLDGERLIRFGEGALAEAPRLLATRGFAGYALLTTPRALASAPELAGEAADVVNVAAGGVPEAAAAARESVAGRPLVALGGGRVIDSAKAIAGADGSSCAAVPTTLSGAEMTPFHRMPAGVEEFRLVRPSLVIAAPALMASQPLPALAASAMNALAHAIEALYTPMANPVSELAGLRAASLISSGLRSEEPGREPLTLGALLAGYASGVSGFSVHHVVCQTLVRVAGTPHAETNAVMLPHTVRMMAPRAPAAVGRVAAALGGAEDAAQAAQSVAKLSALAGPTRLSELGVERSTLPAVVAAILERPDLRVNTPDPPGEEELSELLEQAL
jgi:alcohol dehydrogenase class IV